VQVMQPVHFQAPDGADVLTPAGAYRVELAGDEQLRLISNQPDTQPLIIVAVHVESRTEQYLPSAEMRPDEKDPDLRHLLLLQPDKTAWEAVGSLSGVQSRGTFWQSALRTPVQQMSAPVRTMPRFLYSLTPNQPLVKGLGSITQVVQSTYYEADWQYEISKTN